MHTRLPVFLIARGQCSIIVRVSTGSAHCFFEDHSAAAPTDQSRPSRVRYKVLGLTFLVSFVMYLDRVCMGTAAPLIMREFGLDKITMGWSVSAFNWAYAI